MESPARLRWLANWNRSFAEVASESDREWRNKLADYLDRRADELERTSSPDENKNPAPG